MALAASTVLELERDVTEWSTDIPAGDELDRAHASLRSLILELGRLSETGTRDPREVVGPFVEALLELRNAARRDGRFVEADLVRERLAESGIEVRDTPDGSEWLLRGRRHRRNGGRRLIILRVRFVASAFGSSPHRPAAEDIALSRRKHGFESRWGCQSFDQLNGTFLALARGC